MLKEHYLDFHSSTGNSLGRSIGEKRKLVDDDITPMIEVMPLEIATKNRAVYEGPSRSLSMGRGVKRWKKN
jgi:hypothetical protein